MFGMQYLTCFVLRPLVGGICEVLGLGDGDQKADAIARFLGDRLVDHSQRLPEALRRASKRAWLALEIALAGESLRHRLDPADDRAFRRQIRAFLDATPLAGLLSHGPEFRQQCLRELQTARRAGALRAQPISPADLARQAADFSRHGNPQALLDAEWQALEQLACELRQAGYAALAHLLSLRPVEGEPLLTVAVRFFFRREVETDPELSRGLAFVQTGELAEAQQAGFAALEGSLQQYGQQIEEVLDAVADVRDRVLDLRAEQQQQGQHLRELHQAVLQALTQHQLERRELQPRDSISLRSEGERLLVKQLVARYRALPEAERKRLPALLYGLGKLQVVTGDFRAARCDFEEVAALVADVATRAEAHFHAYRAALEGRCWDEALAQLRQALALDPARFAPCPLDRYEPQCILGAGGFGVALLCRHRHMNAQVVVKALFLDELDRTLDTVFAEAQALRQLDHGSIIRVLDCGYTKNKERPYLVMDYFPGISLEGYVQEQGPLALADALEVAFLIAEGLKTAHARGILHRDVKPANVLLRRETDRSGDSIPCWQVKLIDFGLTLQRRTIHTTLSHADPLNGTLVGNSIAGTLDYAAPEQLGRLPGVSVGPHSDVYGFARTCCFALFGTPQPRWQHWQQLPASLRELLDNCLAEKPEERPPNFEVVLHRLEALETSTAASPPPAPAAARTPSTDSSPNNDREKLLAILRDAGLVREFPATSGIAYAVAGFLLFGSIPNGIVALVERGRQSVELGCVALGMGFVSVILFVFGRVMHLRRRRHFRQAARAALRRVAQAHRPERLRQASYFQRDTGIGFPVKPSVNEPKPITPSAARSAADTPPISESQQQVKPTAESGEMQVDPAQVLAARERLVAVIRQVAPLRGFPLVALPFLIPAGLLGIAMVVTAIVASATQISAVGYVSFGLGVGYTCMLTIGVLIYNRRKRRLWRQLQQVRDCMAAILAELPEAPGLLGGITATQYEAAAWRLVRILETLSGHRRPLRVFCPGSSRWLAHINSFKVFLDGELFGFCSLQNGFDISRDTTEGKHQLLIEYPFGVGPAPRYALGRTPLTLDFEFGGETISEIELRQTRSERPFEIVRMS